MRDLLQPLVGLLGAGVTAACCLGVPVVLAALGAAGLGFLIQDAYLFPLFVTFVTLVVWRQYRAGRRRGRRGPFAASSFGAAVATVGLGLLVTGVFPATWAVLVGLTALVAGSAWDVVANVRARRVDAVSAAAPPVCAPPDGRRRSLNGAALAVAAAGAFYGLYKGVDVLAPAASAGEIACYGVNACKGLSACTTRFNTCSGQNDCKGKGFLNVPERECYTRGGVPLAGSPADPTGG